jgi:hypothetical protein
LLDLSAAFGAVAGAGISHKASVASKPNGVAAGKCGRNGGTHKGQGNNGFTNRHDQAPLISTVLSQAWEQPGCNCCITVLNVEAGCQHRADWQITNTLCTMGAHFEDFGD